MRWSDSARLVSGKAAISSALITSTIAFASRLTLSAALSDARKPVTMISSSAGSLMAGWAADWALA